MNSLFNQYDIPINGVSHLEFFFPFNIDYQMAITPHTIRIEDIRQYLETNSLFIAVGFFVSNSEKNKENHK